MNKNSYFHKYFSYQMWRLTTCTVFSIIFAILGTPALSVARELMDNSTYDYISIPLTIVGIISVVGMFCMSFATPVIACQHLYKKVNADNILSLPVTATERFFGDMCAIFLSYFVPLGASLIATKCISSEEQSFLFLKIFIIMIMFVLFNTTIMTCCGRLAECIIYPIALNLAIMIIPLFGVALSYSYATGVSYDITNIAVQSPVMLISPIGAFLRLFDIYYHMLSSIMLPLIIITIVYGALAYLGYRFRKAENIGKPFVFRFAYIVFSSLTAVAVTVIYFSAFNEMTAPLLIPLAILLFIIMLVMEVIFTKSFKLLGKFFIRYGITFVGSVALCIGLLVSKGFGASYYIPDTKDIDYVDIGFSTRVYITKTENNVPRHNYVGNNILTSDPETIDLIRAEHEYIIDKATAEAKQFNIFTGFYSTEYEGSDSEVETYSNVTYYLKNGKTVCRSYEQGYASPDGWQKILDSNGARTAEIDRSRIDYNNYYSDIYTGYPLKDTNTVNITNIHNNKSYYRAKIDSDFIDGITEALYADLSADENYGRHEDYSSFVLELGNTSEVETVDGFSEEYFYRNRFVIYESYTNTIEFLSRYTTLPNVEQSVEDSVADCKVFSLYRFKPYETGNAYQYVYSSSETNHEYDVVFITAEEFRELEKNHVKYNYNNGDDGYVYFIKRGFPSVLDLYSNNDVYKAALENIDIDGDIIFSTDAYNHAYNWDSNVDYNMLNTDYNAQYREIMESRTDILDMIKN